MAMSPGLNFPSATGYPAPIVIDSVWRRWQPRPEAFLFRNLLPEMPYSTEFVAYDVIGSPTGRLSDGNMDSAPQSVTAGRSLETVILQPLFRDRLQEIRPSDALRTRKPGTIDRIDPAALAMRNMEEIGLAIEVEQELMRVGALTGSLQPTVFGANSTTYTYSVQTFTTGASGSGGSTGAGGYRWSDLTRSTPIADIMAAALLLRGKGLNPTLYVNLTNAQYLAQNAQIVNLAKQSVYANQVGPGAAPGSEAVSNEAVGSILKQFTGIEGVVVYDEGYKTSGGTYTTFLPDTTALLIGKPPLGQPLGHLAACPSIHNGSILNPAGGRFLRVFDLTQVKINGPYQMYGGFNGIPALVFPESIVSMTVGS